MVIILEIPRLYIRDVNDKTIATLDRGDYFDDTLTRFLAGKASVLEFTILKREGDYELFSAGKKISFKYEGEEFWLNMMITDQNEKELTVTALSINMEFNNETVGPFSGKEWTFKQYFDNMLNMDYSLTLGINEVSDKKISNEWTGTSTLLARLFSLATVFSAELEFVTELNPNGSLKRIVLNVYKEHSDTVQGLGADRRNETFRFGKDIKTVRKSEDASGVYTAIRPYGKDGLSIASIEKEIFDENGKLLFATYKAPRLGFNDPGKIYAPQSRDVFPSTVNGNTDKWTVKETDEMEYSTAEALFGYALGELKNNCVPKTEWEIEGYIKGRIGDTIRVADSGYKPEIYLDARITEQTISFTKPSQNKSTFSNVKELQSQVSTDLLKEMEKIIEANKVYSCTISTDNGIIFKNGEGSTTLTAIVRDSAVEVTDKFSIEWFKDGVFLDIGAEITVNASNADGKSVYKFVAKKADETVAGMYEVTVTDVSDGKKGDPGTSPIITPNEDGTITIVDDEGTKVTPDLTGPSGKDGLPAYVHNAWAWSADGTDRFTTVYPRENLFKMASLYNGFGRIIEENTVTYPDGIWAQLVVSNEEIKTMLKPNTTYSVQYIFELLSRTEGTKAYNQNQHGSLSLYSGVSGNISIDLGNVWYYPGGNANDAQTWTVGTVRKRESTFTTPSTLHDSTANYRIVGYTLRSVDESNKLVCLESGKFYDIKFEENPTPTIYTPSPSEDYANAYPKYMGTCSDNSPTASTNPADYHWQADPTYLKYVTDGKVDQENFNEGLENIYDVLGSKTDAKDFQNLQDQAKELQDSYESFTSSDGQYEIDLANLEARATELYLELGDKLLGLAFINTWFKVGEEGLVIGSDSSSVKMLLSNNQLSFVDAGQTVAYFTSQSFYINRGVIALSFQVGSHKITKIDNDYTVFQWVG